MQPQVLWVAAKPRDSLRRHLAVVEGDHTGRQNDAIAQYAFPAAESTTCRDFPRIIPDKTNEQKSLLGDEPRQLHGKTAGTDEVEKVARPQALEFQITHPAQAPTSSERGRSCYFPKSGQEWVWHLHK